MYLTVKVTSVLQIEGGAVLRAEKGSLMIALAWTQLYDGKTETLKTVYVILC